jgi:hypothetical protein
MLNSTIWCATFHLQFLRFSVRFSFQTCWWDDSSVSLSWSSWNWNQKTERQPILQPKKLQNKECRKLKSQLQINRMYLLCVCVFGVSDRREQELSNDFLWAVSFREALSNTSTHSTLSTIMIITIKKRRYTIRHDVHSTSNSINQHKHLTRTSFQKPIDSWELFFSNSWDETWLFPLTLRSLSLFFDIRFFSARKVCCESIWIYKIGFNWNINSFFCFYLFCLLLLFEQELEKDDGAKHTRITFRIEIIQSVEHLPFWSTFFLNETLLIFCASMVRLFTKLVFALLPSIQKSEHNWNVFLDTVISEVQFFGFERYPRIKTFFPFTQYNE